MSAENGMLPGSLELAYLGDTIYDLYIREHLVRRGGKVRDLHKKAVKQVCAHAQAEAFARIEPMLTEEEAQVARRARNCHQTPTKNASAAEYHTATSLEALIGYLYYMGRSERVQELLRAAVVYGDQEAE